MDSLITAAARALAAGDPIGALRRVALRDDAPALALRGIAMAQLGDLVRAKALLRIPLGGNRVVRRNSSGPSPAQCHAGPWLSRPVKSREVGIETGGGGERQPAAHPISSH